MIPKGMTGARASHILRAIAMLRGCGYDVLVPETDLVELTKLVEEFGKQFEADLMNDDAAWDGIE